MGSLRYHLLGVLIVLAVGALFLRPVLRLPAGRVVSSPECDTAAHFFAWRDYGFGMMRHGRLALWNPYVLCGVPFLANIQSGLLYPPNLLFLRAPTDRALNHSFFLHFLLAGLAAYALGAMVTGERFGAAVAGCSYMLSANVVHRLYAGHLPALSTLVWLPVGLCLIEAFVRSGRLRWCVLCGVAGALQIAAGHVQYAVYSQMLWWVYLLARLASKSCYHRAAARPAHILGCLFVLLVLPLALAAAQLMPALEFASLSVRADAGRAFSAGYSFPPWQLATLLAPDFFGSVRSPYWGHGYFWEAVCYVGASTLVLSAAGARHRERGRVAALALMGAASLLLALGSHTPVLEAVKAILPGLGLFRGPSKFIFGFMLSLCVLAGAGASALVGKGMAKKTMAALAAFGLALCIAAGVFCCCDFGNSGHWARLVRAHAANAAAGETACLPALEELPAAFLSAARSVAGSGIAIVAMTLALALAAKRRGLGSVLILVIIVFELMSYGGRFLTSFDSRRCHLPAAVRPILQRKPVPRVIAPEIGLLNRGMTDRVSTLDGFDAIMPARCARLLSRACARPVEFLVSVDRVNEVTRLLGAKHVLYRRKDGHGPGMVRAFSASDYELWEDSAARDRVFVEPPPSGRRGGHEAAITCYSAHRVCVEVDGAQRPPAVPRAKSPLPGAAGLPATLVLSDTHYPGWRAYVDGRREVIQPSHEMLRGVRIAPHVRAVTFVYHPKSFMLGVAVSLLAGALVVFCAAQVLAAWACAAR